MKNIHQIVFKKYKKLFSIGLLFLFLGFFIWTVYPVIFFNEDQSYQSENSIVTDRNGNVFFTFPKPQYTYQKNANLNEIPQLLKSLIVWKEDRHFNTNYGIEFITKLKLFGEFILTGNISRGGSTITEQWLKNKYFLDQKRTFLQKLRELFLAGYFSITIPKETILEEYLNHIYFGNLAYGVEIASNFYFQKSVSELNPIEQIFLVSLISNPSVLYNENWNFTEKKQFYLQLAHEKKWISDIEFEEFLTYKIKLDPPRTRRTDKVFFVELLQREIPASFSPKKGGLIFESSLDINIQADVNKFMQETRYILRDKKARDLGVVLMNGKTGEILSLIGSSNPENKFFGHINTVLQKRQIASTIKPFLFYFSFLQGVSPDHVILDAEKSYPVKGDEGMYRVRNFNGYEYGLVSVAETLANSLNIGSVKLLNHVGVKNFWSFCKQIGFDFEEDSEFYGLSLALGTPNNSLLNLVSNYSLFLNQGRAKVEPQFLKKIIDTKTKRVLYKAPKKIKALDFGDPEKQKEVSAQIVGILSDENLRQRSFGFNSIFNDGKGISYKTGTSADFHDNLAIGFDKKLIVGIWAGNLDNEKMDVLSGIEGSGPLLKEIIKSLDMEKEAASQISPIKKSKENFLIEEDFYEASKFLD